MTALLRCAALATGPALVAEIGDGSYEPMSGADPERVPRHATGHARGRGALGDDRAD